MCAGVEGVDGAGAAQAGARAREGRDVSAVDARQHAAAVRLLRPHHPHSRPQVGQDAQGVPRTHLLRQRGRLHARRTLRALRVLRRQRQGQYNPTTI